jgi:hypothetical protein
VTPAEAIEAAELAGAETAYRLQFAREMAEAAYQHGHTDGYLQAVADFKAFQHGLVRDVELETERWGPAGREHFGDPRPGDYPGRVPAPRQPEPEPELEAGT